MPDVQKYSDVQEPSWNGVDWLVVVEVTPVVSGTANPMEVLVTKKFNGTENLEGYRINICDHQNPDPVYLEVGKRYIMELNGPGPDHEFLRTYQNDNGASEYILTPGIVSTQCAENKSESYVDYSTGTVDEVTDGFYETDRGKAWIAEAKTQDLIRNTIPVRSTQKTILLQPFYDNKASVTEGRDIMDEEYKAGEDVCLIPDTLARYNNWSVGDTITLPLYFANYKNAPILNWGSSGGSFGFSLLNRNLELYQVFEEDAYKIVGIYTLTNGGADEQNGLSPTEIIIPYASVTGNYENNILSSSPMRPSTTAFEIPNGTIERYLEQWNKQGISNLSIEFQDKGYSKLKEGIDNRRKMAWILLGGVSGYAVSKKVTSGNGTASYYDETFSSGSLKKTEEENLQKIGVGNPKDLKNGTLFASVMVLVGSVAIAGVYIGNGLKKEPLELLGEMEEL